MPGRAPILEASLSQLFVQCKFIAPKAGTSIRRLMQADVLQVDISKHFPKQSHILHCRQTIPLRNTSYPPPDGILTGFLKSHRPDKMSIGFLVLSSPAQVSCTLQRGCIVGCCLISKAKTEASSLGIYEKRPSYGLAGTISLTDPMCWRRSRYLMRSQQRLQDGAGA